MRKLFLLLGAANYSRKQVERYTAEESIIRLYIFAR